MSSNTSITFFKRLEPKSRTKNIEANLQAQIRDPLWMLSRQWQLGEFKGDDAGTAAYASIDYNKLPIKSISNHDGSVEKANIDLPLEIEVEKEPFFNNQNLALEEDIELPFGKWTNIELPNSKLKWNLTKFIDAKTRVEMGLKFHDLLKSENNYNNKWFEKFLELFPFLDPKSDKPEDFHLDEIDDITQIFFNTICNRVIDGGSIYYFFTHILNIHDQNSVKRFIKEKINGSENLVTLIGEFIKWCNNHYNLHHKLQGKNSYWLPDRLEYKFSIASPISNKNTAKIVADEYYEGQLDWYSFSKTDEIIKDKNFIDEINVNSIIPSKCEIPGMPASRWWKFEDGKTNFGKINTNLTDISKLMLIEFALIHSDDWLIFPLNLEIGNFYNISSLIVTDTFGETVTIEPANIFRNSQQQNRWAMFKLYNKNKDDKDTMMFFLPPVIDDILESPPIEKVMFLRDEMANMIWGIEQTLPNGMGEPVSGFDLHQERKTKIEGEVPENEVSNVGQEESVVFYKLQSEIAENWIPFVPIYEKDINENGKMMLVRSAMLKGKDAILPKGKILTPDVVDGYKIFEEEVQRTGVTITRTFQRARGVNGEVYVWLGRRKRPGKGEGMSGLRFDMIVENEK